MFRLRQPPCEAGAALWWQKLFTAKVVCIALAWPRERDVLSVSATAAQKRFPRAAIALKRACHATQSPGHALPSSTPTVGLWARALTSREIAHIPSRRKAGGDVDDEKLDDQ